VKDEVTYASEPEDKRRFIEDFNKFYTTFARAYDVVTRVLPFWKRWLKTTIPHIQGPRVLEVSFGTGYLLTQYAAHFETYGIDYNEKFVEMLEKKLIKKGISAVIRQGDVQALPYEDDFFDSIVNTMSFTGYPDGEKAMSEMHRVLKTGGKLIMVDVNYPFDRNGLGMQAARTWIALGDIVRDMEPLFRKFNFKYTDEEIGVFGSVHLYLAEKV
jgi:ubiquinone/menaquinone biosynthesis C-methylase UbiE